MTEEARFATTGVLDEAFFTRNARYLLSPRYIRTRVLIYVAMLVVCLTGYFTSQWSMYLYLLAAYTALVVCMIIYDRRRAAKTLTKRLLETTANGQVVITTSCTERGIRGENQTNGGVTEIEYAHLTSLAMAEGAMILMTKASQFMVFFTDSISEQEQRELRCFLEEKCPKLKIIR